MLIDGREIADFIKRRHAEQIKAMDRPPTLAIVQAGADAATASFVRAKKLYAGDIGARVEEVPARPQTQALRQEVERLGRDTSIDGIIVQLPLPANCDTDAVLTAIPAAKDVDGLTPNSQFAAGTPTAILWLLAAYGVELKGKLIAVVGQGKLVGGPLTRLLRDQGLEVLALDINTLDLAGAIKSADVIICGVGQAGLIKSSMVKPGAVVIDAGTSLKDGRVVGDVEPALYDRPDLKITPVPGGVGPMTVAVLFDNLVRAASAH